MEAAQAVVQYHQVCAAEIADQISSAQELEFLEVRPVRVHQCPCTRVVQEVSVQ